MKLGDKLFERIWVWVEPNGVSQAPPPLFTRLHHSHMHLDRSCKRFLQRMRASKNDSPKVMGPR